MLKISIPTPCHEDWNKMTADETGRHCSACAKSVVDFTAMSDDEVKYFFLDKKAEDRVCGRFKQTQLQSIVIELPQNIFSIQMPLWKKFLAACLVIFSTTLFSCETKINGARGKVDAKVEQTDEAIRGGYVGMVYTKYEYTNEPGKTCTAAVDNNPATLKGDVMIVEEDTTVVPVPVMMGKSILLKKDTSYTVSTADTFITGLPIKVVKAKNPPKADSINCKTIKNYY